MNLPVERFSDHVPRDWVGRMESIAGNCPVHGPFTTVRLRGTDAVTCPRCFAATIAKETDEAAFQVRVAHLRDIAHLPERYAEVGFGSFVRDLPGQHAAYEKSRVFMRAVRDEREKPEWRTLVLTGGPGAGKTHIVCALANNLISRGVGVRYTTATDMLADIKRAYSTDGLTEAGQVERYVRGAALLILDEADVMRGTDNDAGLLFAVVNGRYNARRPMVVVSNQPLADLALFLGDRVASRLRENSVHIVCDWPDFRVKYGSQ